MLETRFGIMGMSHKHFFGSLIIFLKDAEKGTSFDNICLKMCLLAFVFLRHMRTIYQEHFVGAEHIV